MRKAAIERPGPEGVQPVALEAADGGGDQVAVDHAAGGWLDLDVSTGLG